MHVLAILLAFPYICKRVPNKISAWHVTLYGNCKFFVIGAFSFGPCSFHLEWHFGLKFCLALFYRCSFHLVPKASWTITYVWLQLSYTYTYSYIRCFGCSFVCLCSSFVINWTRSWDFQSYEILPVKVAYVLYGIFKRVQKEI